jgi:hypothetical protein
MLHCLPSGVADGFGLEVALDNLRLALGAAEVRAQPLDHLVARPRALAAEGVALHVLIQEFVRRAPGQTGFGPDPLRSFLRRRSSCQETFAADC